MTDLLESYVVTVLLESLTALLQYLDVYREIVQIAAVISLYWLKIYSMMTDSS